MRSIEDRGEGPINAGHAAILKDALRAFEKVLG
ncbi:MAG: hypothetical protein ACI9JL_000310 [Paracoccaceae bacterium]|jgi:hypothetical protein